MDASNLNKRISFISVGEATDPDTDAPIETVLLSAWADVNFQPTSEAMKSDEGKRNFQRRALFTVRKSASSKAITASRSIRYDGNIYNITAISEDPAFITFEGTQTL